MSAFQSDQLRKVLKQDFKLDGSEHYAEEILLEFGNDFVEDLVNLSVRFASQRGSSVLESQDIKMALSNNPLFNQTSSGISMPSTRTRRTTKIYSTRSATSDDSSSSSVVCIDIL